MSHRKPQPSGRSVHALVAKAFTPVTVTAFIALALVGILVVAAVGGLGSSAIAVPTVTVTATVTAPGPVATVTAEVTATVAPARKVAPTAAPAAAIAGNGTFLIGSDVKSGVYRSAGPAKGSASCDWVVRSHTKGLDRIVASKNATGPTMVTLPATAFSVQTAGCLPFQRSVRKAG